MKLLLTLSVIVSLLSACSSTRTYQKVNQIVYPENRLPEDTRQIVVLNGIVKDKEARINEDQKYNPTGNVKIEKANEFGSEGKSGYMMRRLIAALKRSDFYLVKPLTVSNQLTQPWNSSMAKEFITEGDALLVLVDFASDYAYQSNKIRKHQLDQDGKDYYIDAYEASRDYEVYSRWAVYHGDHNGPLYEWNTIGQKTLRTQGLHKVQTTDKLDSISIGLERYLMDSLANEIPPVIVPSKIFDSWTYYIKGADALKEGRKYMETDNLSTAMNIYRRALKAADKKSKARLYYNLAVIHDIQGDANQALKNAEDAYLTDNKYLHKALYDEMKLKLEWNQR